MIYPNTSEKEFKEANSSESQNSNQESNILKITSESGKKKKENGKLISSAINQGFSSFVPDMMFNNLTKDFSFSKKMYGEKLLKFITGYDLDYIKKNINIPEFKRELNLRIKKKFDELYQEGLVDYEGNFTDEALKISAIIMYTEELDKLKAEGFYGNKELKEKSSFGMNEEFKPYKNEFFREIDMKKTIRKAIRRGHRDIQKEDLIVKDIKKKGSIYLIYAVDVSGSMRGKKIEATKKAGIALAFKSIEKGDKIGVIAFNEDIREKIYPTSNFNEVLYALAPLKPLGQTNITKAINESLAMFPREKATKRLIIISDAMPTVGENPKDEIIKAISLLRANNIKVSLIGIDLDEEAVELAKEIINIGEGKFLVIKDLNQLDTIVLKEYFSNMNLP